MKLVTLAEFRKLPFAEAISGAYIVDLRVFPPTSKHVKDIACDAVTYDQLVAARIDPREPPRMSIAEKLLYGAFIGGAIGFCFMILRRWLEKKTGK